MSTAADTFKRAIKKLEQMRAASDDNSTGSPEWIAREGGLGSVTILAEYHDGEEPVGVAENLWEPDADLIVVLHGLIEPLIDALRAAVLEEDEAVEYWAEQGKPNLRGPASVASTNRSLLALAKRVLGEE